MAATGDLEGAAALLTAMEAHDRVSQDSMRWTIAFWWDPPKVGLQKIRALSREQPPQIQACFEAYLEGLIARQGRPARGLPASCDVLDDANWRVRMLARQGDIDGAYAGLKDPIPGGPLVLYYPEMRGVRTDPRFWPLARRIGLADYWVRSGHWPDFCAEPGLPYDCRQMARATSGT
jgi:hypothetical protein